MSFRAQDAALEEQPPAGRGIEIAFGHDTSLPLMDGRSDASFQIPVGSMPKRHPSPTRPDSMADAAAPDRALPHRRLRGRATPARAALAIPAHGAAAHA